MEENEKIIVKVNKVILGYLAALTKTEPKMVIVNLRDMASNTVNRLVDKKRRKTWSYITYPNTDLRMRVKCESGFDSDRWATLTREHNSKIHKMTNEAVGYQQPQYYSRKKFSNKEDKEKHDKEHRAKRDHWTETWRKIYEANPHNLNDSDFRGLIVEFDIKRPGYISMTQDEIDTVLIEDILLAPPDQEEENEE